jgi:hypothetical protein
MTFRAYLVTRAGQAPGEERVATAVFDAWYARRRMRLDPNPDPATTSNGRIGATAPTKATAWHWLRTRRRDVGRGT